MPRTKRPVARKPDKSAGFEDAAKKQLKEIVDEQKRAIDNRCEMEARNVELAFKILVGSLGAEMLQRTIGELRTELLLQKAPATNGVRRTSKTRSASRDDGYNTERSQSSGGRGDAHPRRSRSTARPRETNAQPLVTAKRRRSRSVETVRRPPPSARSVYKTPAYNRNAAYNYPVITPKVVPNTPLTVLRRPRQGEMVVSMSGSPLMVPSMQSEEKANCNIPLHDGTILSLQPEQLRRSQAYIPFALMDPSVLKQLQTLKNNLDTVVKLGEKKNMK